MAKLWEGEVGYLREVENSVHMLSTSSSIERQKRRNAGTSESPGESPGESPSETLPERRSKLMMSTRRSARRPSLGH